jgi:hypothetical protein
VFLKNIYTGAGKSTFIQNLIQVTEKTQDEKETPGAKTKKKCPRIIILDLPLLSDIPHRMSSIPLGLYLYRTHRSGANEQASQASQTDLKLSVKLGKQRSGRHGGVEAGSCIYTDQHGQLGFDISDSGTLEGGRRPGDKTTAIGEVVQAAAGWENGKKVMALLLETGKVDVVLFKTDLKTDLMNVDSKAGFGQTLEGKADGRYE